MSLNTENIVFSISIKLKTLGILSLFCDATSVKVRGFKHMDGKMNELICLESL
jgi:hypothetical protein